MLSTHSLLPPGSLCGVRRCNKRPVDKSHPLLLVYQTTTQEYLLVFRILDYEVPGTNNNYVTTLYQVYTPGTSVDCTPQVCSYDHGDDIFVLLRGLLVEEATWSGAQDINSIDSRFYLFRTSY